MPLAILFQFLCTQHVSDINISIISSCEYVVELPTCASACKTRSTQNQPHQISNTHRTENKMTDVVIQQHSRKLRMMDILISETCWAQKKWNKKASDIKLDFHSSTITMMHAPINIRLLTEFWGKYVVCLPLKFSAGVKGFSVSVIGNKCERLCHLKWNSQLCVSSCHKLCNSEDTFYDTPFLYTVTNYH